MKKRGFVSFLPTLFVYVNPVECHICKATAQIGFATIRIDEAARECAIVVCCTACCKIDKSQLESSFVPMLEMQKIEVLRPWLEKMLTSSYGPSDFISSCNANKKDALKLVSRALFSACTHCKKAKSKFRCSFCHCYRFCSKSCAKEEWSLKNSCHKHQCGAIGKASFICNVVHKPK